MDSYEKLRNVEASIRAYLGHIRKLEVAYAIARGEEIALGLSSRRPFLKSRGILQQLKLTLRKARETQKRYNKTCKAEFKLMLLEELIINGDVFVQAKQELSLVEKNAEYQNEAYRIRLKELRADSYNEGPSAITMINSNEQNELVKIARMLKSNPSMVTDNVIKHNQDNTIAILQGTPNKEESVEPIDDIDDFFKEEGEV